ncbi:cupin domain-containing protein [Clostridium sporogenes]|uniref:Cupin domain-containing protein n=1 Tax=Clostridium botulinum TaxID=1491 RepID=A0AAU8YTB5_CLOBO|nr:cupin domain-containing protein [Clostridium sporogenes]AVP62888.1 cupin domain-containing protein [Clostridium botulinum]EHN15727.1 hypothetical protein IYC_08255 [Clostridium sporogenes PA 3679]KYN76668.1 cupin [Clostridium sporogenes]MBW5459028.1 cupin domain-containing protein [Clostridium sporogenes]MCF4018396.1 cupin domain-containing protein [Clostridium sporogenes]
MYNPYGMYPCFYCFGIPMYNSDGGMNNPYDTYPYYNQMNRLNYNELEFNNNIQFDDAMCDPTYLYARSLDKKNSINLKDYGPRPFVVDIEEATKQNNTFRTALWTGKHLQVTLMSINVGDDIGLEMHPDVDQFIRVEEGQGLVKMGSNKDRMNFQAEVYDDFAIMIPAGTWHNIINTGNKPLKVYSIYAPPEHPHGTVHKTKADAEAAEENHH